jgi:single-stranded-DNA-specific exonuclease
MARYALREIPKTLDGFLEGHPQLMRDLLALRVTAPEQVEPFLSPSFERHNHDPFLLPDMEAGVARILRAIENKEKIAIWSDYDCDGIPGGALLHDFFKLIGYENFVNYIPHRHLEGYGLNAAGIEQLAQDSVTLVLTVDSGITDVEPVARANELGVDVVITDHHLPLKDDAGADRLPAACAVINPKRQGSAYPFDGLSGTGVAWKLCQAILARNRFGVADGQEKWLLDLVAIATVADMMPLVDENRALVHFGLVVLRKTRRPGLQKLYSILRIKPGNLSEEDIGFGLAPRINAASRMDQPRDAFELLIARENESAHTLARHLDRINNQRKGVVASTVKEINKRFAEEGVSDSVIVMGNPSWRPGLLGLVANSVAETHKKPVFLWGREGGETIKGSCRSDGVVNLVELMALAKSAFVEFGGHKFSGGFSVSEEKVHTLREALEAAYVQYGATARQEEELFVDRELALEEVSAALPVLLRLAPFGIGNEKPLFRVPGVTLQALKFFGKEGNHLEFIFSNERARMSGIAFFSVPDDFTNPPREGLRVDVIAHIERDWAGRPRLRVVDVL